MAPRIGRSAVSSLWRGVPPPAAPAASPKHRRLRRRRRIAEVAAPLDRFRSAIGGDAGLLVGEGLGVGSVGSMIVSRLGLAAGAEVGALRAEPLPGSDLPLRENLNERAGVV